MPNSDAMIREIRGMLLEIWEKMEKWQQASTTKKEFEAFLERINRRLNSAERLIELREEDENDDENQNQNNGG